MYRKTHGVVLNLLVKDETTDHVYLVSKLNNAETVLRIYARRMTIEEGFRDLKNGFLFNRLRLSHPDKVGMGFGLSLCFNFVQ
ncbi:MAG: transposase [bacterium]